MWTTKWLRKNPEQITKAPNCPGLEEWVHERSYAPQVSKKVVTEGYLFPLH